MTGWMKLSLVLAALFVTNSTAQAQYVEEIVEDDGGYYETSYVPAPVYVAPRRVVRVSYARPVFRGGYRGGFRGGYRGGFGGYRGGFGGGFGGYRGGFGAGFRAATVGFRGGFGGGRRGGFGGFRGRR